jgi:hypothetical protein
VAAANGQVDVIRVLVELGANKNAKSAAGMTPLLCAAANGHVEAIKVLVQLGADIAARLVTGETPLQMIHQVAHVLREAAAEAAATAERLRLEEEATQLAMRLQSDAMRMHHNALRLQSDR